MAHPLLSTPARCRTWRAVGCLALVLVAAPAFSAPRASDVTPWRAAGLTEEEAAAHLLYRFTFGPRPGDVDAVVEQGLFAWLDAQIAGVPENPALERALGQEEVLRMTSEQMAEAFPSPGRTLRRLQREGKLSGEQMAALEARRAGERPGDDDAMAEMLRVRDVLQKEGFRPRRELQQILGALKLMRAAYSNNQLQEVLVDFWFNHFNVSLTDNEAQVYVLPYERDAIRPHARGSFGDMLAATARHPAMLLYLDNAQSRAAEGSQTTLDLRARALRDGRLGARRGVRPDRTERSARPRPNRAPQRPTGLNENYARELLELHTLGVDGGYTQEDVVEVARAFTGWTVLPPASQRPRNVQVPAPGSQLARRAGMVFGDGFFFHPGFHDAGRKTVLGTRLPAGGGIDDGERVLELLEKHPSTAQHIARKLAVRFVSDTPPQAIVDRLAGVFLRTHGDIGALVREIAHSPEFWEAAAPASRQAGPAKIKSPFEVAVSGVRALGLRVVHPRGTLDWVERMGQPLYRYQAPTGFPDRAETWVSSGSLLLRMNFASKLAAAEVPGVRYADGRLLAGREPESQEAALGALAAVLLPGRDPALVRGPLLPMLGAEIAADLPEGVSGLERIAGLILGSPEFQRR